MLHQVHGSSFDGCDPDDPLYDELDHFIMSSENLLGQALRRYPTTGEPLDVLAYQAYLMKLTPQQFVDMIRADDIKDLQELAAEYINNQLV